MTCHESPVLLQMLFMYNLDVSSAVIVLVQGVIMVALLRQSTTTNRELYPCEFGRSVIKSMVTISHMSVGTWFGCSGTWFGCSGTWFGCSGTWFGGSDTWFGCSGTWFGGSDTWFGCSGTWFLGLILVA